MDRADFRRALIYSLMAIVGFHGTSIVSTNANPPAESPSPPSEALPPSKKDHLEQAIQSRRTQIATLQHEIEELQKQLASGQQIEIELKMYEVNRTKMRQLGIDWTIFQDGVAYTKEGVIAPPEGDQGTKLIQALEHHNIAKMLSHDKLTVTCGEPFTFKQGAEFTIPLTADGKSVRKVPKKEVSLTATPQANGTFGVAVRSKLAQVSGDSTVQLGKQMVPAVRVQAIDTSGFMLLDQEVLLHGLPAIQRTEAIRTESGIKEVHQEIETYFSIRLSQVAAEPSRTAVHPAAGVSSAN